MKVIPVQIFQYYNQNNSQNNHFTGRIPENKDILSRINLEMLLQEGKTVKEIASFYGINEQKIYKLIKIFSLRTPRETKYQSFKELKPKFDAILPELIKQGKSLNELSEAVLANKNAIIKWIKIRFPEGLRAIKREQHLNFLKSNYSDEEIAEMKGIKSSSVRSMRYQFKIQKQDPEKERILQKLQELAQTSTSISELSKQMGWDNDKTRKYIKKYQLQETLDNNLKNSILFLANQGLGKYKTANRLNIAEPTLNKILKRYDINTVFADHKTAQINTILELKKQGLTSKQISEQTGVPVRTVRYYTSPKYKS